MKEAEAIKEADKYMDKMLQLARLKAVREILKTFRVLNTSNHMRDSVKLEVINDSEASFRRSVVVEASIELAVVPNHQ